MKRIFFISFGIWMLASASCNGKESDAAVARIQAIYASRAQVSDGWLSIMEQNAADPATGLKKGLEYVSTNGPALSRLALEICYIIGTHQKSRKVRDAFQKVNEEVKLSMEPWKVRAEAVNEKYPGEAQALSAMYLGLNASFFKTAQDCLPR